YQARDDRDGTPPRRFESSLEQLEGAVASATRALQLALKGEAIVAPFDLARLLAALPAEAALLEYYTLGSELVCFVVDRDGPRLRRGLGTVEQVEVLADRLRFQLGKGIFGAAYLEANIERSRRNLDRVLRDLWQLLLAPIGNVLRDARHLVVVPHGPLHGLPLHAAFDGASYLADRYTLSYAPSGRTFIACAERNSGPVRRPLFVGPQDYLLPSAAREARTLSN